MGYEAPHYAVFSNILSLHLSSDQIFYSVPCSQTPTPGKETLIPMVGLRAGLEKRKIL
jgi:hypothetical protein